MERPEKYDFEAGAAIVEFQLVPTQETCTSPSEEYFDMRQVGTYTSNDPPPDTMGKLTHVAGLQICDEKGDGLAPAYIGARKQSNNTAELTALYHALWRAAARPKDAPPETIYTDSLYAKNVTLGVWKGSKKVHRKMIRNLRLLWRRTQIHRGPQTIHIEHMRSHIGWPGNELADRAAGLAMAEINENIPAEKNARPPPRLQMQRTTVAWARTKMREITGSNRLQPPPPSTTPSTNHSIQIRTGDG